jgi:hypothetical protein
MMKGKNMENEQLCFGELEALVNVDIDNYAELRDPSGRLDFNTLTEEFWRDKGIDRFARQSIQETFGIVE